LIHFYKRKFVQNGDDIEIQNGDGVVSAMRHGAPLSQRYVVPILSFLLGLFFSPFIFSNFQQATGNIEEISIFNKLEVVADGPDLLVLIVSAPHNAEKRAAIRETWLSSHHSEIRGYFVVGVNGLKQTDKRNLEEEDEEYEDLIFLDISDSYKGLTEKVLRMLEYAHNHFVAKLLMKCDDDTFINTPLLAEEIRKSAYQQQRIYWGFFDGRAPVLKKGKWSEPSYQICDRYVPYALGGGYVISWKLVNFLARSLSDLKVYQNEDVSMGTWLAGIDVVRIHDERFDTEWKSRGCSNNVLVRQNTSPHQMKAFWARITAGKKLCSKEFITRPSYSYNWEVPPSQCCNRRA